MGYALVSNFKVHFSKLKHSNPGFLAGGQLPSGNEQGC